jgi:hypothetical protein
MAAIHTLARPHAGGAPTRTAGVRLTGIRHSVFRDRHQPLIGFDAALAHDMLSAYGRADEFESFLARTGNSFIAMSESLLAQLPEPLPELDAVLLAYHTPDLYHSEVAGCYLSQRLPGAPVPCSVAEQGPGAPFTALRIADGMHRLGELDRGLLFAYDQNAAVWEADEAVQSLPDAAVLLELGGDSAGNLEDATVAELEDVHTGEADAPTPAGALDNARARHPDARVLIGAALAAELTQAGPAYPTVTAGPGTTCTGVWSALLQLWPICEPVLVADYHAAGGRFHSCLLVPSAEV